MRDDTLDVSFLRWANRSPDGRHATFEAAGKLWIVEHGPRGGDEVNVPERGRNYGWPVIGYGIDWLFGTLPFGLIIFLLLGFGAGFLNLARAANRVPPAQERLNTNPPPKAALDDDEEED